MAVLFGAIGLLYSPLLLIIAIFVWIGAGQEAVMAEMKSTLGGIPVHQAMVRDFKVLSTDDSLQQAVEYTMAGHHKDFPVVSGNTLKGILRQTDLFKALSERDALTNKVASVERGRLITVDATEPLDSVAAKFVDCDCQTLPVTQNGKLVGLVTTDKLSTLMRLQADAAT